SFCTNAGRSAGETRPSETRVISPGANRSSGRLIVATRIDGWSVGANATRTTPARPTTAATAVKTASGLPPADQANPLRHASSNAEANHATRKVMPQMPATAATCISGSTPYWVYAIDPHVAIRGDRKNSTVTNAIGNTRTASIGPARCSTIRSTRNGTAIVVAMKAEMTRKIAPEAGRIGRNPTSTETYTASQNQAIPPAEVTD